MSHCPDNPPMDSMEVPDGYVQLPHGMGLVKEVKEAKEAKEPSPQGRYSLRPRKSPNRNTQTKLSLKITKPLPKGNVIDIKSAETNGYPGDTLTAAILNKNEPPQEHCRTAQGKTEDKCLKAEEEEEEDYKHSDTQQKSTRKRIPLKDQSPYQRYTTVRWGETPFVEHTLPSAADCEQVFGVLKEQHANGRLRFERPAKVPPPSLEVAGCGETQQVLDGLNRTILSGSKSMKNANNAIQNIVQRYGSITKSATIDGEEITPVKNCIDWNKVREMGKEELRVTIGCGGLQKVGSEAVANVLETTYTVNNERITAFKQEKEIGIPADVAGAATMAQSQKDMEIWMFDNGILSLEHLRALPMETVMNQLVQFRGVGVKTAACVILFCLQEPCFAVDTHCFRIAQWLGWIPQHLREDSGRDKAFAHLNVRIPDHLKYGLHQLFIEHGQNCHRCVAGTVEGTKNWQDCVCPLEDLLSRQKTASKAVVGKTATARKRKAAVMEEEEDNPEM